MVLPAFPHVMGSCSWAHLWGQTTKKQALRGMPGPQTPLLLQSRVSCSILHQGWAPAKHFSPLTTTTPHPLP